MFAGRMSMQGGRPEGKLMAGSTSPVGILDSSYHYRRAGVWILALLLALLAQRELLAQTSLTGAAMALKSLGSSTMSSPGYLGTYLTIPSGGATIDFTIQAAEGSAGTGRCRT